MTAIAIVSTAVGLGGAEGYMVELASWLTEAGIDVTLVVAEETSDSFATDLGAANIPVIPAAIGWDWGPEDDNGGAIYLEKVARQKNGMETALAALPARPDMVLFNANWATHYIGVIDAADTLELPFSVHFHLCPHKVYLNPEAAKAHSRLLPMAEFLSCVSDNNRFFLQQTFGPDLDFKVILNGTRFEVTEHEISQLYDKKRDNVFVLLGRLDHQKGILDILPAFGSAENLAGFDFHFLGDGPLRPILETLADSSPCTVNVLGRVDNIRERLECASAMVLPSHFEGLSLSILEAMSLGCVPIVSRASSAEEIIQDGVNGFLFDVGDWRSMVCAIQRFNSTDTVSIRKACINHARRFTRRSMLDHMREELICAIT